MITGAKRPTGRLMKPLLCHLEKTRNRSTGESWKITTHTHLPHLSRNTEKNETWPFVQKNFNQLYAPILPGPFLAWAKRTGIDVVSELFEGIEAQGVVIADWKDQYDNLQIQHDQLQQQFDTLAQQHEGLIQEISDINAAIHNRSSSLSGSQYWQKFEALAVKAVSEFPNWVKTHDKIQKTGNLLTWLTSSIGADNREADLIKKILSDFFSELK